MEKLHLVLEDMIFGNRVTLKSNVKLNDYSTWYIQDTFNGETDKMRLEEPIYGFFHPMSKVDVILVKPDGKENIFKNVSIVDGGAY